MKTILKNSMLLLLCAVLALSTLLTGCNANEPHFPVPLSDMTRSALELNTDGYTDAQLSEIYRFMCDDGTVKSLNDKYAIRCLRKDDDGCRVIYWGQKKVLVLRFDNNGEWIQTDKLHSLYRLVGSRANFDQLSVGDPVIKVQQADYACFFPFLADKSSEELETNHYTEDGYHVTVLYDADFNITSVTYELM